MKGGKTPIHIMRWAPADFLCDPFVLMLVCNGMFETYVFYRQFIDVSFVEGGRVKDDIRQLAALSGLPENHALAALEACLDAGKLVREGGMIFNPRVVREIERELVYRTDQSTRSTEQPLEQKRAAGRRSAEQRKAKYGSAQPFSRTPERSERPAVASAVVTPSPAPSLTDNVLPAAPAVRSPAAPRGGWVGRVLDSWPGTIDGGHAGKALKGVVTKYGEEPMLAGLARWLEAGNAKFGPEVFARDAGAWIAGGEERPESPLTKFNRKALGL